MVLFSAPNARDAFLLGLFYLGRLEDSGGEKGCKTIENW